MESETEVVAETNYQELVQEYISKFGTSYATSKASGLSQTQLLKYEKGETSGEVFTAAVLSVLLKNFSEARVVQSLLVSVKQWEEKQDLSKQEK